MVILLGVVALAIDASYFLETRDRLGAAADAAARGAADELVRTTDPAVLNAFGQDAASRVLTPNGDNNGVTVTINYPPTAGPFAGDSHYVEAVVTRTLPTFFMRVLGTNSMLTANRATAGGRVNVPCVLALDSSAGTGALSVNGTVDATGCTFDVNSSAGNAANCGASLNASTLNVVGTSNCSGAGLVTNAGAPTTVDPLSNVQAPSFQTTACTACGAAWPAFCTNSGWKVFGTATVDKTPLDPGIYCNGIAVTTATPVTMNAGTYVLFGGSSGNSFAVAAGSTISGSDVTIYNTGSSAAGFPFASINIPSALANVSLSAPSAGPYSGLLFFQDRTNAQPVMLQGGGNFNLTGVIYAPGAAINYSGGSGSAAYTAIIGSTVTFTGGATLGSSVPTSLTGGLFQDIKLAE